MALLTGAVSRILLYNGHAWPASTRERLKGIYLLILRLDADLADFAIGRLGCYCFTAGYYLYVGSAFGSGGITARLAHHQHRPKPRLHWHIDYLREHAALLEVWGIATPARLERCWAHALALTPGLSIPAPGFGASDSDAASHLFYTPDPPARDQLMLALLGCAEQAGATNLAIDIRDCQAAIDR